MSHRKIQGLINVASTDGVFYEILQWVDEPRSIGVALVPHYWRDDIVRLIVKQLGDDVKYARSLGKIHFTKSGAWVYLISRPEQARGLIADYLIVERSFRDAVESRHLNSILRRQA